jgi:RNA polymerase sigma-70 factor (ECF subfamily)
VFFCLCVPRQIVTRPPAALHLRLKISYFVCNGTQSVRTIERMTSAAGRARVWTGGIATAQQAPVRILTSVYNEGDGRQRLEFCLFDAAYVNKLAAGDPATEAHFSAYFAKFLTLKLRTRRLSPETVEDVRQETLFRVLKALRRGAGVSQPERFGAFVNSVCNNVVFEFHNKEARNPPSPEHPLEPADDRVDMDAGLVTEQRKKIVAEVLSGMNAKDREILRLVFFEEADRQEVSRRLGVDAGYLRVLLHRAKSKFEQAYLRKRVLVRHVGTVFLIFVVTQLVRYITIH